MKTWQTELGLAGFVLSLLQFFNPYLGEYALTTLQMGGLSSAAGAVIFGVMVKLRHSEKKRQKKGSSHTIIIPDGIREFSVDLRGGGAGGSDVAKARLKDDLK